MTEKELRKLKRVELLELLVEQAAEMDALRAELEEARQALKNREISLQEAGTLAEAALRINEVFAAADRAAQDYLHNVQALAARKSGEASKRGKEPR